MSTEIDFDMYEHLVFDVIESHVARDLPTGEFAVTHNRRLMGASGHDPQIDVVVEFTVASTRIVMLVECKCRSTRKVSNEEVYVLSGRLKDVGAHKGLLVTTVGFQDGADKVARANGIALVVTGNDPATPEWRVLVPLGLAALLDGIKQKQQQRPLFGAAPRVRGRIKKLVADRGFGFVEGDRGELFFHHSVVIGCNFDDLREGQAVEFEVGKGRKGPCAENVRMIT